MSAAQVYHPDVPQTGDIMKFQECQPLCQLLDSAERHVMRWIQEIQTAAQQLITGRCKLPKLWLRHCHSGCDSLEKRRPARKAETYMPPFMSGRREC